MTPDEYCRAIEAYLCRKNDGHLIRVVGPSFERVAGWAERGIPIKIACRGIDRYFERYYARGPRRRPVRIDFCEADVLDAFDEWRRAVGFLEGGGRGAISLPAHLDRVILKLTALRGGGRVPPSVDAALERTVRELDAARAGIRSIGREARARLIERLQSIDQELVAAAREACDAERLAELRAEAELDLRPFRDRMPEAAHARAVDAAVDRLLREVYDLPAVAFE